VYTPNKGQPTPGANEVVSTCGGRPRPADPPYLLPFQTTRFYDGGEKEIIIGGGLPSATMKTRGMTQPASDR
jgi:hypothetical protein